jgi:ribosomal protein L16 Arg81 hydroxylase
MRILQQLLSPYLVDEFLAEYWTQKAIRIPAEHDQKFQSFFSWHDLNHLLNCHNLTEPDLRFSLNGESLEIGDSQDWNSYLRQGATLIINGLHRRVPTVIKLAADLRYDIGYRTHVNLYCSPSTLQGFDCHYDNHDVFILQIEGEKEWFVFRETTLYPVLKHSSDLPAPDGLPYLQCVLKPGDLLYIPRGHWHYATGCGQPSLHLTVGIDCQTGLDWINWLMGDLQKQVNWRQSLPAVVDGDTSTVEQHLDALRQHLIEVLSQPDALGNYVNNLMYRDLPPLPVNLPTQLGIGVFPDALLTRFSWSPWHRIWVRQIGEEHYQVQVGTKQIELKGISEIFVKNLFNHEEFGLFDVADWASDLDFDGDIAPLIARLVAEGILQVKTDEYYL